MVFIQYFISQNNFEIISNESVFGFRIVLFALNLLDYVRF